jgi:diguanylate cyclase (GGDEF)-like protein
MEHRRDDPAGPGFDARTRVLLDLARAAWTPGNTGSTLGPVLEAGAELLEAERVSFWRLDAVRQTLRPEHVYLRSAGRHLTEPLDLSGPESPSLGTHALEARMHLFGREVGVLRFEPADAAARPFSDGDRTVAAALADLASLALDRWQRRMTEERLAYASLHDPLTDLPNRRLFTERVERSIRALDRRSGLVAVLLLDLDRFHRVNESLGPEAGDQVLIAVARAVTSVLRPADLPGRLDGDHFAVLLERLDEPWEAIAVAERVQHALGGPLILAGTPLRITASIGVALTDGSRPRGAEELLADAEQAVRKAKQRGRARFEVFESAMRPELLERMEMGWALRDALAAGQLRVAYQPEVSLRDGRLLGAEALLRWQRPGRPEVVAADFVELAESGGLIETFGAFVLREACRAARGWRREAGGEHLVVRVNLSAPQFERSDLVATVAAALAEAELPAHALCLEITESVLMSHAPASLETLTRLKALGVALAVDDFGIGYSSLAYLRRFPVDALKIDRGFVAGLGADAAELPIVQAVLGLGQALRLDVVAEGVERPAQAEALRTLGCERAQGFLFGPAEPAEEIRARLLRSASAGVAPWAPR